MFPAVKNHNKSPPALLGTEFDDVWVVYKPRNTLNAFWSKSDQKVTPWQISSELFVPASSSYCPSTMHAFSLNQEWNMIATFPKQQLIFHAWKPKILVLRSSFWIRVLVRKIWILPSDLSFRSSEQNLTTINYIYAWGLLGFTKYPLGSEHFGAQICDRICNFFGNHFQYFLDLGNQNRSKLHGNKI